MKVEVKDESGKVIEIINRAPQWKKGVSVIRYKRQDYYLFHVCESGESDFIKVK